MLGASHSIEDGVPHRGYGVSGGGALQSVLRDGQTYHLATHLIRRLRDRADLLWQKPPRVEPALVAGHTDKDLDKVCPLLEIFPGRLVHSRDAVDGGCNRLE